MFILIQNLHYYFQMKNHFFLPPSHHSHHYLHLNLSFFLPHLLPKANYYSCFYLISFLGRQSGFASQQEAGFWNHRPIAKIMTLRFSFQVLSIFRLIYLFLLCWILQFIISLYPVVQLKLFPLLQLIIPCISLSLFSISLIFLLPHVIISLFFIIQLSLYFVHMLAFNNLVS